MSAEQPFEPPVEPNATRWKWIAYLAIVVAVGLLIALVLLRLLPRTDERLMGTWESDADRTMAGILAVRALDAQQEAFWRKILGKLQLKYFATSYSTKLEGVTETYPYEVLGGDQTSVVIRSPEANRVLQEHFAPISEFSVIHFDGPDAFWIDSEMGGMREYFKRVR